MNLKVYKHLLQTYGRKPAIWFAVFTELVRSLINRVYVVILLASMAAAITSGDVAGAKRYAVIYLVVSLVAILATTLGDLASHHSENVVYGDLQHKYYRKLTNKDMSFYRDNQTGYLTVMLRQYVDSSIILVRLIKGDFVRAFVSLTIPAVVLFAASYKIGLLAISLIVFQVIYMVWASSKTKKYRLATHHIYREISGEIADDVTNITAYKAAGHEAVAQQRMVNLRVKEMNAFWQRRKTATLLDAPRSIVMVLFTTMAFWVVLSTSTTSQDSIKLLVLTLTYMFQIIRNTGDLPNLINQHDDLISKLGPTLETLDPTHEHIKDPVSPVAFTPTKLQITIKNLDFKYLQDDTKQYIFKDLNLSIQAGEHIGVVGLSGAGKSTLASLLMRFDDIQSGEILFNDINIQHIAQSNLRQNIAYVPQEPILFHRTIKQNIAYQNDDATDEAIQKAAKAAHAHEFITKLPKGYDTIVGERGVKLSGGQKQRIVIARAILKNAPLILFDEATSALDSESEHIIQQALPTIIGSHTAIIIAHRLSTVAGLDRIIVMHDGKIEDQGTHKQLLANKGRYYSLWQKQTRNQIS